ncbi:MAG: hypothetical protein A07HR60_02071 [uncultured archaeon A07HR60]|nr:MAG: hypothetical protein A07HR60_02071 [uncultured archaeon A07HR60]
MSGILSGGNCDDMLAFLGALSSYERLFSKLKFDALALSSL